LVADPHGVRWRCAAAVPEGVGGFLFPASRPGNRIGCHAQKFLWNSRPECKIKTRDTPRILK
jgi:hypothetical protein